MDSGDEENPRLPPTPYSLIPTPCQSLRDELRLLLCIARLFAEADRLARHAEVDEERHGRVFASASRAEDPGRKAGLVEAGALPDAVRRPEHLGSVALLVRSHAAAEDHDSIGRGESLNRAVHDAVLRPPLFESDADKPRGDPAAHDPHEANSESDHPPARRQAPPLTLRHANGPRIKVSGLINRHLLVRGPEAPAQQPQSPGEAKTEEEKTKRAQGPADDFVEVVHGVTDSYSSSPARDLSQKFHKYAWHTCGLFGRYRAIS